MLFIVQRYVSIPISVCDSLYVRLIKMYIYIFQKLILLVQKHACNYLYFPKIPNAHIKMSAVGYPTASNKIKSKLKKTVVQTLRINTRWVMVGKWDFGRASEWANRVTETNFRVYANLR